MHGGLVSLEDVCRRYMLTVEEFLSWQYSIDRHGLAGLRTTRTERAVRAFLAKGKGICSTALDHLRCEQVKARGSARFGAVPSRGHLHAANLRKREVERCPAMRPSSPNPVSIARAWQGYSSRHGVQRRAAPLRRSRACRTRLSAAPPAGRGHS